MPKVSMQHPPVSPSPNQTARLRPKTGQTQTSKSNVGKPTASIIDRIAPISFDHDEGIKILLYGRSGTGKTTLWSTFPGPILVVLRSGGGKPGELLSVDTPEMHQKIRQVKLEISLEINQLTEWLNGEGAGKYKTVVLDHASGLQDLVLAEVLGVNKVPEQLSWGLATQQQYGQVALQCKEYLRAFLNLSCNVVIISQERESNKEQESELILPTVGAALMPSLAGWLYPACDYICETFIRQKERKVKRTVGQGKAQKVVESIEKLKGVDYCLRTGPHSVYTTKFRKPKEVVLPDEIIDPDYSKLIKLIRG